MTRGHRPPERPEPPIVREPHDLQDRWLLRPAVPADAPAVLEAFTADPAMTRQGEVTDLTSARDYLSRVQDPSAGRYAWVAVNGSGPARTLVGTQADRVNLIGRFFYWSHREVHGTGIMKRAATTVANHALHPDGLGLERLELGHRANDPASGGVARAAGFVQEGIERGTFFVDGERLDVLTYGRLRTDPSPASSAPLLSLRTLCTEDAEAMSTVLKDAALYRFTGGGPATREELRARYGLQVVGRSPDGSQRWVNDVVLLDGQPVGYVQATVTERGATAELAWVIGRPWQGRGVATQASRLLVARLVEDGVRQVIAHVHPENRASQSVARRLGMEPTGVVIEGETRWEGRIAR